MRDAITAIINEWDPANLMSHAPDDEYEYEIGQIEEAMARGVIEPYGLAREIHAIFVKSFGEDRFTKSVSECRTVAGRILSAM